MKLTIRLLLPLLPVALLATGCTSRLIFATHSSIGLDVSGTAELPNKVSFSFSRYEAAIVPRKTNGEAHSVYGGMDADVTWFHGHAIKQTFATGEAAKLATANPAASGVKDPPVGTKKQDKDALVFFTATTYGLKLAIGEDATPPNLLLGYRRSEAAVIPIPDPGQEVRSVYADIQINTRHDEALNQITTNFSAIKGTRIKQSFATGRAAENLAGNPVVRAKPDEAAGLDEAIGRILEDKETKRKIVLTKVTAADKTVDGEILKKLLADPEGKLMPRTENWVERFGGKPMAAFEKELRLNGDRHLDVLAERAKMLP